MSTDTLGKWIARMIIKISGPLCIGIYANSVVLAIGVFMLITYLGYLGERT